MKFKVGDRVRVVKIVSNHSKDKHLGKILTIKSLNPNGDNPSGGYLYGVPHYGVEEEEVRFVFLETELNFEFTKSDLKDGMVVEYRNGDRRLVLGECFVGYDYCSHFNEWYDDNLINNNNASQRDVCKVYKSSPELMKQCFDDDYLALIWERPEEPAKKMTVAEIEKELGYKVEIVSEDN